MTAKRLQVSPTMHTALAVTVMLHKYGSGARFDWLDLDLLVSDTLKYQEPVRVGYRYV